MISALFLERGLRRDCVSGRYGGVGVGGGEGFSPLLVISALFLERGLRRDCVSGRYEGVGVGVGEWVFSPACDLGAVSRAGLALRLCVGCVGCRNGCWGARFLPRL